MTHPRKDGNTNAKNLARTPPKLFEAITKLHPVDVDAFANSSNHLCPLYMSDDGTAPNALTTDWDVSKVHYGNCPYSNPAPFVEKAYNESLRGCKVVLLLPADMSPKWFDLCMNASEWLRIPRRVKFNNPDGTPMKGSPKFASMVVVFDNDGLDGAGPWVREMRWK